MSRKWRSDDTDKWKYGFGSGQDGALTVGSNTTESPIDASCSGTSGAGTLSATNVGFAPGQLILIHQTRGTGAGEYEFNKIESYSAGTITLKHNLQNTYTDSGASQAQVYVIKQYTDVVISSTFTYTGKAWGGDVGGIMVLWAKNSITVTGTISLKGSDGRTSSGATPILPLDGGGFRGGGARDTSSGFQNQGESSTGAGSASSSANGAGGGSGGGNANFNAGGGGGHGAAGTAGSGSQSTNGAAGGTAGNAALTIMVFGGAGGGACGIAGSNTVSGCNGGGIVILVAPTITITGAVSVDGGGYNVGNYPECGGGGAGGSILFKGMNITLGSALAHAAGGVTTNANSQLPGDGGVGRIHADYSKSITGTTSPTIDTTLDATIVPTGGAQSFLLLMTDQE